MNVQQLQPQCYFQFMDGVEVPQWQLMFVGRLKMLHSINPSTPLLNVSGLANDVFILVGPEKACSFGTACWICSLFHCVGVILFQLTLAFYWEKNMECSAIQEQEDKCKGST